MNLFWKALLVFVGWCILVGIQVWKKEAWTYGPVYSKEKSPGVYKFFITLYSILVFTFLLLLIKIGRDTF